MRKKVVKVLIDGEGPLIIPLELDDFVQDHSLPMRLAVIFKRAITEHEEGFDGLRWDPDDLARDREVLGQVAQALGQPRTKRKAGRRRGSGGG